ncbi:MAG: glycosyltransferase family 4 protein [Acidobacteriota bacterium]
MGALSILEGKNRFLNVRVLFLNQTFYPDVASTSQYASDLAAALVDRGHDVTVVCSRRAYDNPGERYPPRETWRGVEIRRISNFGFGKKTRWRRAADFGSYIVNCTLHLVALRRFDVVVGMTSPPLISWLGAHFARIKGGRFAFWVMDLNPDEAVAAGWLRQGSRTTKFLQAILRQSLHAAAVVIVLDRFMAKLIEEKGIDAGRIVTVPPWSHDDAVRYDAEGRDDFRTKHGLNGKFVVMYSGNHSPCHPLATLLEAARKLRDRGDIAFCFAGGGSEFETVRQFVARHGLTNIVIVPYQPLNKLAASLSSADLHTVVMGDPFVGIVHPCKVYNIRALGIPYLYIGPEQSHVTELAPAFSAIHGDVDAVAKHIETAATRATAPARTPESVRTSERLLGQMVSVLEDAAGAVAGRKIVQPERSPQF